MLWLKAFHLIFLVTWFAGLFYLPRLFVYHAMTTDSISDDRFQMMERKLFWGIMTPSALLTVLFGGWMMKLYGAEAIAQMHWLHIKLVLVGILLVYHLWTWKLMRSFRRGENTHSHIWYRWFNEAPVIVLILIVLLAVLKPSL